MEEGFLYLLNYVSSVNFHILLSGIGIGCALGFGKVGGDMVGTTLNRTIILQVHKFTHSYY